MNCLTGTSNAKKKTKTQYYMCRRRRRPAPGQTKCAEQMHKSFLVDGWIWSYASYYFSNPKAIAQQIAAEQKALGADTDAAAKRLDQLKEKLLHIANVEKALLARFEGGLISEATMDAKLKEFAAKRKKLTAEIGEAQAVVDHHQGQSVDLDSFMEQAKSIVDRVHLVPKELQREMVEKFVNKVTIGPGPNLAIDFKFRLKPIAPVMSSD